VDHLDYLYGDASLPEEVPVTRYPDSGRRRPAGRHRDTGRPDYTPARFNSTPARQQVSGRYPAKYAPNGRPTPGYPPYNSGPMPAYPPSIGRRAPGYPPNGRPAAGYPPYNSGPMPAYPPSTGRRAPGYPPNGRPTAGYPDYDSGPMPAYPLSRGSSASGHPLSDGKRILGWLPFGQRLVLLPKGTPFGDGDEELREHRDVSGGWLRPAVFGAMDGLVTNSSLIAGIGGGGGSRAAIVLSGIAGLIAGAFSMATGEYISVTSQNELTEAEVELERKQHARDPAGKLRRLTEVFIEKGVSPNLAEAVVRQISADSERAIATHVREELGIDPDDLPSPRTAAAASFAAFTVGALIPLSPFLLGYSALKPALVIAGVAAVAGGAAVAKLTGRSLVMGGLRQFTAAFLATGMAFVIGHLISGHVA
jgi:vacuolar iron transporter family protein